MNYYISDLHFGHKNSIKFDERPFENEDEMERVLIENWNAKVTDEDDVWILGDLCYRSGYTPEHYLKQLKGKLHFIIGNHDHATLGSEKALSYFESVENLQQVRDGELDVILCHYPLAEWNYIRWNSYHVYGHIHANRDETYEFMKTRERALNAGCMINNYEPVTLEELIENNRRFQEEHEQAEQEKA